jgi:hypothetical protein
LTPARFVGLLVLVTVGFGLAANHGVAGGSDSYGYVSQADLWLRADLHIAQPEARRVPWPFAQWTLSPLGYRPSVDQGSIVPVYAPGLSMLMAAFKGIAGQCAIAWVVPLCGGLLVVATFAIGRRIFSDQVGAAGAFLLATSPTMLFMVTQPMSDVPVAAFWALATFACLIDTPKGDALAGVAASAAILIRPNLAHLGMLMAMWLVFREARRRGMPSMLRRPALFSIPVAAAAAGVALLYQHLYGSPTTSGYGSLETIYSISAAPLNVVRYGRWLIQSQTPLALLGLLGVFVPFSAITREVPSPGRGLLGLLCVGTFAGYLFWNAFDAWWYLRFLLTAWPAICLTAAALLAWPSGRTLSRPARVALVCAGLYCLWFSYRAGTFNFGEGDRRYATVAKLVRDATPPNSMIFSAQHSGSVRYYGGRMSLRYDWLSERWLDRSVAWLNEHGVRPYFLLDEGEIQEFRRRFEGQNVLGRLDLAHVWEYHSSPNVFLFDPLEPGRPGEKVAIFTPADVTMPSCPEPVTAPQIVLKD